MRSNFYCKIRCGDPDFSIDEWNKAYRECINMGLSDKEMDKILEGEPCEKQCSSCADTVIDTNLKNRQLTGGTE